MSVPQFDDTLMDKAIETVLDGPKHDCAAKIGAFTIASGTEDILYSPIDDTIIFGRLQDPEPGTADKAVDVANEAFAKWSSTSPAERKAVLVKLHDLMVPRLYRMAAEVLLSTGVSRKDAFVEACAALDAVKRAADACDGKMGKPLGVVAVVSIQSSPLAVPVGYAAMALAAGNTVVVMPSGTCPKPVFAAYELFKLAGVPDGAINVVCDRVDRWINSLCDNLNVMGVVASGCGQTMDDMMFLAVDDDLRFKNEIKGMNPVVVSSPGDMKKAAVAIWDSVCAGSGRGLYACSKVFVKAEEARDLLAALVEKLKDLKVGDPTDKDVVMGPLMNDKAEREFGNLMNDCAEFIVGGGRKVRCDANGRYYTPLLLTGMDTEDEILYADSGLPVLAVRPYATIDALVSELDQTECGHSVGIMSTDSRTVSAVKKFAEEEGLEVWGNEGSRGLRAATKACVEDFTK